MRGSRGWNRAILIGLAAAVLGAAPVAPSYRGVEQVMDRVQDAWKQSGAEMPRNAPGWIVFFDALRSELRAHAAAPTGDVQLRSLDRLYRMSVALGGIAWEPAAELRAALRAWLGPRVRLAWAERRLIDTVRGLPPTSVGSEQASRNRWIEFVDDDLGKALRDYEFAANVAQHQAALHRINDSLRKLKTGNSSRPWEPSVALQAALDDLFNRPNLDVTADVLSLSPALNTNVVKEGPVFFKGQWSYVTAGPKTGFGLLPSDNGIAFYNSQMMTSVTPIRGFYEQMRQDPRARRVTKLYHFDATSQDHAQLTITAVLRSDGLHLTPSYVHNVDAAITAAPMVGGEFGRSLAALLGFNQQRITRKVYQGAIGQIRSGAVEGSLELGTIRTNEAADERNENLRKFLVGNNTLVYRDLAITSLALRSRPEHALVGGTVCWRDAAEQVGADTLQPAKFEHDEPGITVDLHLPSLMTNLMRGYLQSETVSSVQNIMVVTQKVPPDASSSQKFDMTPNVDFSTFGKAVATARAANDPKVVAIRIKKPERSPEFAADTKGNLVALVHELAIEVPAPPQAARGGGVVGPPAEIYRISAPQAEFVLSFKVEPAHEAIPIHLLGRIESFDAGPGAKVYAVTDDETKAVPLTLFTSAVVLRLFGSKLQGQPIDMALSKINLPGFHLESVSPLDSSGWIRIVLNPTGERPTVATGDPNSQAQPSTDSP